MPCRVCFDRLNHASESFQALSALLNRKVRQEESAATSNTKFLRFLSYRNGKGSIFEHETYRYIKAAERFIVQGEVGDIAYIIQRGTCPVIVEKDGKLHHEALVAAASSLAAM